MSKQEMFQLLLDQFLLLNENRDMLIQGATTGDDAQKVLAAWRQANLNQLDMGAKLLVENTPEVERIVGELQIAQTQVEASLTDLQATADIIGQVTGVINMITTAVSLGTQLVALV